MRSRHSESLRFIRNQGWFGNGEAYVNLPDLLSALNWIEKEMTEKKLNTTGVDVVRRVVTTAYAKAS